MHCIFQTVPSCQSECMDRVDKRHVVWSTDFDMWPSSSGLFWASFLCFSRTGHAGQNLQKSWVTIDWCRQTAPTTFHTCWMVQKLSLNLARNRSLSHKGGIYLDFQQQSWGKWKVHFCHKICWEQAVPKHCWHLYRTWCSLSLIFIAQMRSSCLKQLSAQLAGCRVARCVSSML